MGPTATAEVDAHARPVHRDSWPRERSCSRGWAGEDGQAISVRRWSCSMKLGMAFPVWAKHGLSVGPKLGRS